MRSSWGRPCSFTLLYYVHCDPQGWQRSGRMMKMPGTCVGLRLSDIDLELIAIFWKAYPGCIHSLLPPLTPPSRSPSLPSNSTRGDGLPSSPPPAPMFIHATKAELAHEITDMAMHATVTMTSKEHMHTCSPEMCALPAWRLFWAPIFGTTILGLYFSLLCSALWYSAWIHSTALLVGNGTSNENTHLSICAWRCIVRSSSSWDWRR